MLDSLRQGAQSWVAKALLGLLTISFGIWGIADVFKTGLNTDVVAKVGKQEISARKL